MRCNMDEDLSCTDIASLGAAAGLDVPHCCRSCQDDELNGYADSFSVVPLEYKVTACVCCTKASWVREHWHILAEVRKSGKWQKLDEFSEAAED